MAEGMSMVKLGGKQITSPRCQRTKWPLRSALNSPKLVMMHWPQQIPRVGVGFGDSYWAEVDSHGRENTALKVLSQEQALVEEHVEVQGIEFVYPGGIGSEHVGLEASNVHDGGGAAELAEGLDISFRIFHI
jgi:hypothetical protein